MKEACKYKVLTDSKLIIMYLQGDINADVVINFINSLVSDPKYRPEYSSLVDMRKTDFNYDYDDIKRTLNHMKMLKGFSAKRKTVYITSNSKQVVPPMLLNKGSLPMKAQVSSTLESAIKYLSFKENMLDVITKTLQELQTDQF